MDNLHFTTRRAFLKAVPAAAATMAIPVTALAASDHSRLPALIGAQRTAAAAARAAWSARSEAEDAFDALPVPFVLVPFALAPDGTVYRGSGELRVLREDAIRQEIAETHHKLRAGLRWAELATPDLVPTMLAEIDASENRAVAALERALADETSRKTAGGLTAAEETTERADEAMEEATAAVMAYRPCNLVETALKIEWFVVDQASPDNPCRDASELLASIPTIAEMAVL